MLVRMMPLEQLPAQTLAHFCADSFFASHAFAQLWRAKGGRPVVWVAEDAGQVAAILPGVEFGRFFLKRFMSMPDGCYGGVFCHTDRENDRPALTALLLQYVLGAGYLRVFIFDFHGRIIEAPRFREMPLETTLVDISNPDWLPPDKKLQAQIRKAEREGIVVQTMDWPEHGDRFMDLMRLTEKRHHQRPTYPRQFFEALFRTSKNDNRLHWVWCEHEGRGVCSHIYIIEGGMLQGWQVYFDKTFSFLKPNQYIRFTTCRDMARRGIRQLNLGGTPENAPGLCYYKNRWGGQLVRYRGLVHRRSLGPLR